MTTPRTGHRNLALTTLTISGLLLGTLSSGGCRAIRERQARRAAEAEARQAEARQPEPARETSTSTNSSTMVVDERPSSRYRVEERPATGPRQTGPVSGQDSEPREPAFTPEDLAGDADPADTREERALSSAKEMRAMGDIQSALAELERAIAINPRFTPALLEAGDLHMEMGEVTLAERSYAAAARVEPRNFDTQYRHATALRALGRNDDAIRAYLRALAVQPNEFGAMLGLSTSYLEIGNAEQALPYAERAARSHPNSGEARMHLGNVYAGLDRHEEAVIEFRQAAELLPKPAPGLLLNMAESFSHLGRYAEMVGALNEVVASDPTPIAYERLGSGLFRLRRYDEALAAFGESARLDPQYAPALNGVAVCELNNYLWSGKSDTGARERALDAMRRSLRIDRSQPKIVELLRRYANAAPQERAGGR